MSDRLFKDFAVAFSLGTKAKAGKNNLAKAKVPKNFVSYLPSSNKICFVYYHLFSIFVITYGGKRTTFSFLHFALHVNAFFLPKDIVCLHTNKVKELLAFVISRKTKNSFWGTKTGVKTLRIFFFIKKNCIHAKKLWWNQKCASLLN